MRKTKYLMAMFACACVVLTLCLGGCKENTASSLRNTQWTCSIDRDLSMDENKLVVTLVLQLNFKKNTSGISSMNYTLKTGVLDEKMKDFMDMLVRESTFTYTWSQGKGTITGQILGTNAPLTYNASANTLTIGSGESKMVFVPVPQ
jgi:hypothetical protein